MTTPPASLNALDPVAALFDACRVVYGQPSDLCKAHAFMEARLTCGDSHVILARSKSGGDGIHTALSPLFVGTLGTHLESVYESILIMDPCFRSRGVGRCLMRYAEDAARAAGACAVRMATQMHNVWAKHLYGSPGYVQDEEFDCYERSLA